MFNIDKLLIKFCGILVNVERRIYLQKEKTDISTTIPFLGIRMFLWLESLSNLCRKFINGSKGGKEDEESSSASSHLETFADRNTDNRNRNY